MPPESYFFALMTKSWFLWPPGPGPLKAPPQNSHQQHMAVNCYPPPTFTHLLNQPDLVLRRRRHTYRPQSESKGASRWKEKELFSVEIVLQQKAYSQSHKSLLREACSGYLGLSPRTVTTNTRCKGFIANQ